MSTESGRESLPNRYNNYTSSETSCLSSPASTTASEQSTLNGKVRCSLFKLFSNLVSMWKRRGNVRSLIHFCTN